MNFDLRLPLGIMFGLFGAILVIFGAVSNKEIYEKHSLGININLIWGAVLLVFGAAMLFLTWRASKKAAPAKDQKKKDAP
jgi:protein-S-isoprenylcysteine O-methyltransferase Ste14